MIPVHSFSPLD